jgi:hypothetical protein
MDRVSRPPGVREPAARREAGASGIVFWATAFVVVAAMSSLINWDPGLFILGFKGYFTMWILLYAVILSGWSPRDLGRFPVLFLLLAFAQLPFVLHEYLYLVPLREAYAGQIVPVDVVAGTFGALLLGGGANAVLTLFAVIVVACLLGLWKHGRLSAAATAGLALPVLAPVFFNETKIAVIYLPVVFLVLFYRDIVRRPLRFLLMGGVFFAALALLLTALIFIHPSDEVRSWSDLARLTYEKQTGDIAEQSDAEYSKLTRWTALTFWAGENASAHPIHIALGWGPGASRIIEDDETRLTETLAEKRYGGGTTGIRIGYTAFSALLWDVGVVGFLCVLAMFHAAYRAAGRLCSAYRGVDPFRAGVFDGLRAATVVMVISLAHKDFFVSHIPFQTLMLLILGYLVVSQRRLAEEERTRPAGAAAPGGAGG